MLNPRVIFLSFLASITVLSGLAPIYPKWIGTSLSLSTAQAVAQGNDEATAKRLLDEGNKKIFSDPDSDPDSGLDMLQSALKIYRQLNNQVGQQKALRALGIAYQFLGDLTQASNYLQQSIKVSQGNSALLSRSLTVEDHSLLGQVYLEQGQPKKALFAFEQQLQALKAQPNSSKVDFAPALHNIATAYLLLKDYPKAVQSFQQSLQLRRSQGPGRSDPEEETYILSYLGYTYLQQNELQKAEATLLQALQRGEESSSGLLPSIYKLIGQQHEASKQVYGKNNPQLLKEFEEFQNDLSKENLSKNINSGNLELIDLLRVQRAEDSNVPICSLLQKIYVAQNKQLEALSMSERCRARALARRLSEKLDADTVLDSVTPPNLQQIRQIAKSQNATLVQYSILTQDSHVPTAREVAESDLLVWVIPPSGDVTFRKIDLRAGWLQGDQSLSDLVAKIRQSIGARGRASIAVKRRVDSNTAPADTGALKQLHKLLIAPIAETLPKDPNSRVIFIPQGALFSVPFPALIDSSGQYLVDQHTIFTTPSIHALALTQQRQAQVRKSGNQQVLVVGNPAMPKYPQSSGQVLPALPGAETEAKQIASLYKAQAILGSQASETAISAKLEQARIAHFATHGLLDSQPKSPLGLQLINLRTQSGFITPGAIALAPGGGQDGLLTSDEIAKLNLNTELVVLSACDTGQGTVLSDGVVGLSRSLMTAGAPSILVSLWKVPDQATADLMVAFYQQLNSNPDKAQALRQAMLKVRQKYPNPVDWSAFTLIGDAG